VKLFSKYSKLCDHSTYVIHTLRIHSVLPRIQTCRISLPNELKMQTLPVMKSIIYHVEQVSLQIAYAYNVSPIVNLKVVLFNTVISPWFMLLFNSKAVLSRRNHTMPP